MRLARCVVVVVTTLLVAGIPLGLLTGCGLGFDVPAGSAELASRTAQLADEFGRLIAHSVPGVRARKAVVSATPSRLPATV